MKQLRLALIALGLMILVLPAGAQARSVRGDRASAVKLCQGLRQDVGMTALRQGRGSVSHKAMKRCISEMRHARNKARKAAKRSCKTERRADRSAFRTKYGDTGSGGRAMRNCVRMNSAAGQGTQPGDTQGEDQGDNGDDPAADGAEDSGGNDEADQPETEEPEAGGDDTPAV